LSGEPDFVGGFSEDLNAILQAGVEDSYGDFVKLVATARGKTPAEVDTIGQGRVWDGGTARQLGLIDGFGGMTEALAEAAKRAGLAEGDYHPQYLDPQPKFSWLPFEGIPFVRQQDAPVTGVIGWAAQRQKAIFGEALATAQGLLVREDVQAFCLECSTGVTRNANGSASWIDRLLRYSFSSAAR
jgi:protease-4